MKNREERKGARRSEMEDGGVSADGLGAEDEAADGIAVVAIVIVGRTNA